MYCSTSKKIETSELNREELNFIIKKSYLLSLSFIKAKYKFFFNSIRSQESNLQDLAMDSIIPLFVKNPDGKLGLKRSLEKWNDKIESASEADYFLSRIIWRRVDQTFTKILKERDPIFEKILKTLNICIRNNPYKKLRYFGTVLIVKDSNTQPFGEIIDEDNFNLIPEYLFGLKQSELFNSLFEYIINETNYYPAIPLNLLVKRIKYFHTKMFQSPNENSAHTIDEISLTEVIKTSLSDVKEKLDVYYVTKNKLEDKEAEMIYAAFKSISKDMLNGGMHDSLYFYINDKNKTISREIFYSKYHHIMNYLLTRFKTNLTKDINF